MTGFRHEALFYQDEAGFLDGTLDFVRAGVHAGEAVLVALPEPNATRLRRALARTAADVMFVDMNRIGRNPACIIPVWRQFADEHAGRPIRGIGEPAWPGRSPAELVECGHHESLLNLAFAEALLFTLLCPYDASRLPADVLAEARRNHPWITGEGECRSYVEPQQRPGPFIGELPPPSEPPRELEFSIDDLHEVRAFVIEHARRAGLDRLRTADLVVAVSELATNSVRHGGGTGAVRAWRENGSILCEIGDSGRLEDPLVGRQFPDHEVSHGRGLWLVNHLCDLVQIRTREDGSVFRVRMDV